jgi:hypothetical protein
MHAIGLRSMYSRVGSNYKLYRIYKLFGLKSGLFAQTARAISAYA